MDIQRDLLRPYVLRKSFFSKKTVLIVKHMHALSKQFPFAEECGSWSLFKVKLLLQRALSNYMETQLPFEPCNCKDLIWNKFSRRNPKFLVIPFPFTAPTTQSKLKTTSIPSSSIQISSLPLPLLLQFAHVSLSLSILEIKKSKSNFSCFELLTHNKT